MYDIISSKPFRNVRLSTGIRVAHRAETDKQWPRAGFDATFWQKLWRPSSSTNAKCPEPPPPPAPPVLHSLRGCLQGVGHEGHEKLRLAHGEVVEAKGEAKY